MTAPAHASAAAAPAQAQNISTPASLQAKVLTPAPRALLQRQCACGGSAGIDGSCDECRKKHLQRFARYALPSQAELAVCAPGDIYEREADRIADQVMAGPSHAAINDAPVRVNRVAGSPSAKAAEAPPSVERVLASPGSPLDFSTRTFVEQGFGHDFSHVRVHTGAAAEQSAREVNAHAFTIGNNIVFGAGQFAPGTFHGRRLIVHELSHVLQQSIYPVQSNVIGNNQSAIRGNWVGNIIPLQRDAAQFVDQFYRAIASHDWGRAVRALSALANTSDANLRSELSALDSRTRFALRTAALRLHPNQGGRIVATIDDLERGSPGVWEGGTEPVPTTVESVVAESSVPEEQVAESAIARIPPRAGSRSGLRSASWALTLLRRLARVFREPITNERQAWLIRDRLLQIREWFQRVSDARAYEAVGLADWTDAVATEAIHRLDEALQSVDIAAAGITAAEGSPNRVDPSLIFGIIRRIMRARGASELDILTQVDTAEAEHWLYTAPALFVERVVEPLERSASWIYDELRENCRALAVERRRYFGELHRDAAATGNRPLIHLVEMADGVVEFLSFWLSAFAGFGAGIVRVALLIIPGIYRLLQAIYIFCDALAAEIEMSLLRGSAVPPERMAIIQERHRRPAEGIAQLVRGVDAAMHTWARDFWAAPSEERAYMLFDFVAQLVAIFATRRGGGAGVGAEAEAASVARAIELPGQAVATTPQGVSVLVPRPVRIPVPEPGLPAFAMMSGEGGGSEGGGGPEASSSAPETATGETAAATEEAGRGATTSAAPRPATRLAPPTLHVAARLEGVVQQAINGVRTELGSRWLPAQGFGVKLHREIEAIFLRSRIRGWSIYAETRIRDIPGFPADVADMPLSEYLDLNRLQDLPLPSSMLRRDSRVGNLQVDLLLDSAAERIVWDLTGQLTTEHLGKTILYSHLLQREGVLLRIGETYWGRFRATRPWRVEGRLQISLEGQSRRVSEFLTEDGRAFTPAEVAERTTDILPDIRYVSVGGIRDASGRLTVGGGLVPVTGRDVRRLLSE